MRVRYFGKGAAHYVKRLFSSLIISVVSNFGFGSWTLVPIAPTPDYGYRLLIKCFNEYNTHIL